MWNCNIGVVIIPSILALAYLGLLIYHDLLPDLNLLPLGIWLAGVSTLHTSTNADGVGIQETPWGLIAVTISVAFSMAVNALVTGLIVYRIFKAFRKVQQNSTSAEKSLGDIGGRKYRSVISVIIESGIVLFAVQLVRVILTNISAFSDSLPIDVALIIIIVIHQMLNVIITLVIINLILPITSTWLGSNAYHRPGVGVVGIVFRRQEIFGRSHREFALCV